MGSSASQQAERGMQSVYGPTSTTGFSKGSLSEHTCIGRLALSYKSDGKQLQGKLSGSIAYTTTSQTIKHDYNQNKLYIFHNKVH